MTDTQQYLLIEKYRNVLEFCQRATRLPYYSESLLPCERTALQDMLAIAGSDDNEYLLEQLGKFIPHEILLSLLSDFDHVERKRQSLEHDPEAVRRYWKKVHALYGVDEKLGE